MRTLSSFVCPASERMGGGGGGQIGTAVWKHSGSWDGFLLRGNHRGTCGELAHDSPHNPNPLQADKLRHLCL